MEIWRFLDCERMSFEEDVFHLPIENVKAAPFSMDFGTSVAKVLYRAKKDKAFNNAPNQKYGKIRIKSFPSSDTAERDVTDFLKENCYFDDGKGPSTVHVTGVQSGKLEERCREMFGTSFKFIDENIGLGEAIVCFNKCDVSLEERFYPKPQAGFKTANELISIFQSFPVDYMKPMQIVEWRPQERFQLPCIVAMQGSGTAYYEVSKDGKMELIDGSFKGGRTFYGLAYYLTGEKNFDKLVDMAYKGDRCNVDTTVGGLLPPQSTEDNLYARDMPDIPIHLLGDAVIKSRDAIKVEDVLNSLLCMWALDIAQVSHLVALSRKIPRVYFSGSFITREEIRNLITKEFTQRKGMYTGILSVEFQFLRQGSHLSAIGAFLSNPVGKTATVRRLRKVLK